MICSNYKKVLFGLIISGATFAGAMQRDPAKHGQPREGTVRVRIGVANISNIDYALEGWKESEKAEKGRKSILGAEKKNLQAPAGTTPDKTRFHLALGKETDAPQDQVRQVLCIKQKGSSENVFTFANEAKSAEENWYIYTGTLSDGKNTKSITLKVEKPADNAGEVRVQLILGTSLEDSLIKFA